MPSARTTDPETSQAAAASISEHNLRTSQNAVLAILTYVGPVTDEELVGYYDDLAATYGPEHLKLQTHSGIRSRRAELVRLGRVRDTGQRRRLATGRQAIVWGAA